MRSGKNRTARRGFTLVEVLIAMTIFGAIMTVTLSVLDQQVRAFYNGSAQMDATQHLRFAMSALEKDLPTAGSGVPTSQPFLIYADTHVVAFNADYASNLAADAFAMYVDTTMPTALVTSLTTANQITIPNSAFNYPSVNYTSGGFTSPAETIIFYFTRDATTPRTDDFLFWRQVNDQPAELLARNILQPASGRFFKYHRLQTPAVGPVVLDSIPSGWLPLSHSIPVHLAPNDIGAAARIDSLRAVEVRFRTMDDRPANQQRLFEVRRTITLPNAGVISKQTCGDAPLNTGMSFSAIDTTYNSSPAVRLLWNASVDEASGERDVNRYLVWKTTTLPVGTGDPFLNVPAGSAPPYIYIDQSMSSGTYYYAVASQDCTPSVSPKLTATVVIP